MKVHYIGLDGSKVTAVIEDQDPGCNRSNIRITARFNMRYRKGMLLNVSNTALVNR